MRLDNDPSITIGFTLFWFTASIDKIKNIYGNKEAGVWLDTAKKLVQILQENEPFRRAKWALTHENYIHQKDCNRHIEYKKEINKFTSSYLRH